MENNEKKKMSNGLKALIALLLIITTLASCIGLYAWAKYTSSQSGSATAQIAKWNFDLKLKEGKQNAVETSGPIDLASTQFNHVANDRIAPGTSGLFYVIIDTTGTEVDVLYNVNITLDNCPRNIKFYRGTDATTGEELSLGGVNSTSRSFSFSRYLAVKKDVNGTITNENGKKEEPIYWVWDYSGAIEGNATTYDQWDTADSNLGTTIMTITATGTEMLEPPSSGASITTAALGQYVNLGTNLLDLGNITLSDDSNPAADWRVFSKDANGAWLILADYLPVGEGTVGASVVGSIGLETDGESYEYLVWSGDSREDLIDKLNGNWSSLITGSNVAGTPGVQVKGTVDLPTWVSSWNASYASDASDALYTRYVDTEDIDNDNFCATGYAIGDSANPTTTYIDLSSETGHSNTLYFPHQEDVSNCYGYWLASPSANYVNGVMYVYYDGNVSADNYGSSYYGVRPAVYLPSNISFNTSGEVWTIAQ